MIKFLSFLLAFSLNAEAQSQKNPEKPTTKESMAEFLEQFMGLKPYLVSDEAFQNPKNEAAISKHLKGLSAAVRKTSHDPILNQANFKFSREVLQDHVTETERVFRLGKKSYARWMTNSTLGICMSCHSQMPTQSKKFPMFLKPNSFPTEFDRAEFLFATKDFEAASTKYQALVLGFPKNKLSTDKVETAAERELTYRIRVQRDLPAAKAAIAKLQQNKKLPESLRRNFAAWNEQITQWQSNKIPEPKEAKSKEIVAFAQKNLGPDANTSKVENAEPRFISNLVVSGILYEYLQIQPGSAAVPEELYYLAVVDREMSNSPFYSLADLYLRECMLKYPETPTAAKCYKEYETEMIVGYSGSGGTNVPGEVQEELKMLKSYVDSKGKVPIKRDMRQN